MYFPDCCLLQPYFANDEQLHFCVHTSSFLQKLRNLLHTTTLDHLVHFMLITPLFFTLNQLETSYPRVTKLTQLVDHGLTDGKK